MNEKKLKERLKTAQGILKKQIEKLNSGAMTLKELKALESISLDDNNVAAMNVACDTGCG